MSVIHPMENSIILLAYFVLFNDKSINTFYPKRPVQASVTHHLLHYLFHCTDKSKIGEFYTFLHIFTQNQMFIKFNNDLILMVIKKIGK